MKPVGSRTICIHPSRRLRLMVVAAHLLGFVSVLLAMIPTWLQVLLLVLVGASFARVRKPQPMTQLKLHDDGRIELLPDEGEAIALELDAQSVVLPFLVVLSYRYAGRRHSCVALSDSVSDEDFRQLRLWLRWRAHIN